MSNILGKGIFLTTPPHSTQNKRQEYSYKNLYKYPGKKDGYLWGKTVFSYHPPLCFPKYSPRFSHIWPF